MRHVQAAVIMEVQGQEAGSLTVRSDWATDHCPMLFVHSRMVRHRSDGPSHLVKHPQGKPESAGPLLKILRDSLNNSEETHVLRNTTIE